MVVLAPVILLFPLLLLPPLALVVPIAMSQAMLTIALLVTAHRMMKSLLLAPLLVVHMSALLVTLVPLSPFRPTTEWSP